MTRHYGHEDCVYRCAADLGCVSERVLRAIVAALCGVAR